jgi:Zn-dependent peptidase ImmA (M78 family)
LNRIGDVLTVARKARGITQVELADRLGVTQATVNRYENDMRMPDEETLDALARELGVTTAFLVRGQRFVGALAVDVHMRRQRTEKASVWRQLEARLNLLRLHSSLLFEEVSLHADQVVPTFDLLDTSAQDAARLTRAQWRLPIGPVTNLTRWLEAAGCLIFEEDFATRRVDGLSQWIGDHPVILINETLTADRKRLTLAHELAHLALHSIRSTDLLEDEAADFAAEFLMPEHVIKVELRKIDLPKLVELKREWGVSMQALFERAYRLGLVRHDQRTAFYRSMNARGWRTSEPVSDAVPEEHPELLAHIGSMLRSRGLKEPEIAEIAGYAPERRDHPFQVHAHRLRAV